MLLCYLYFPVYFLSMAKNIQVCIVYFSLPTIEMHNASLDD